MAAGWVPELLRLMFKFTVPPGTPDPGERLRATLCAKPTQDDTRVNTKTRKHTPGTEDLVPAVRKRLHGSRSSSIKNLVL
jgi:hypothetical protein